MIPYTAVCKYTIKPRLTITWIYIERSVEKSFDEKFDTRAQLTLKLKAFKELAAAGQIHNYQK